MKKIRLLLFCLFIVSTLFVISQKYNLPLASSSETKEKKYNRSLVDDFVDYSMIRYFGMYTLFGFKPITEMDARYEPPTEEQRQQLYENLDKETKAVIPYDDFILNSPWETSVKDQWRVFKQKIGKKKLKDHFFVEYRFDYKAEEFSTIFFVHRPSLLKVLEAYYFDFQKRTGKSFKPLDQIKALECGGSEFWDKIFKENDHYLMGLLFGYGKKNSETFEQEIYENNIHKKKRIEHTSLDEIKSVFKDIVTVDDLCLPQFVIYDENDDTINSYRSQREYIKKYLAGKKLSKEVFKILEKGVPENFR